MFLFKSPKSKVPFSAQEVISLFSVWWSLRAMAGCLRAGPGPAVAVVDVGSHLGPRCGSGRHWEPLQAWSSSQTLLLPGSKAHQWGGERNGITCPMGFMDTHLSSSSFSWNESKPITNTNVHKVVMANVGQSLEAN